MRVKIYTDYYDLQLNRLVKAGEIIEVGKARAAELCTEKNRAGVAFGEIMDEVKPTPTTVKVAKAARKKKED